VQWVGKGRGYALEFTHHECWQRFAGMFEEGDQNQDKTRGNLSHVADSNGDEDNHESANEGALRQMHVECAGSHGRVVQVETIKTRVKAPIVSAPEASMS